MEKIWFYLFLLYIVAECFGSNLKYSNCNKVKSLVRINSFTVNPDPPDVPGNFKVSGKFTIRKTLPGNLKLDVNIKKKELILYVRAPCIKGFGSCSYDFCDLLKTSFVVNGTTQCPPQGLPCGCPIKAGSYKFDSLECIIPKLPSIVSSLVAGEYIIDVKLTNKDTSEKIACYHVEMKIGHTCSSLLCDLGLK